MTFSVKTSSPVEAISSPQQHSTMNTTLTSPAEAQVTFEQFDDTISRMVPIDRLTVLKEDVRREYVSAKPYPHAVLDGFFDEDVLDRLISEFPQRYNGQWLHWDSKNENKQ